MENKYILNFKTISIFLLIVLLPNLLGMFNLSTPYGFKIHVFQFGIILAAVLYGWIGGLSAGIIGSLYSATLMGNPYIIFFNALLGLLIGLFLTRFGLYKSVLFAFIIQAPILFFIDLYIVGFPLKALNMLLISLFISNTLWTVIIKKWNPTSLNTI